MLEEDEDSVLGLRTLAEAPAGDVDAVVRLVGDGCWGAAWVRDGQHLQQRRQQRFLFSARGAPGTAGCLLAEDHSSEWSCTGLWRQLGQLQALFLRLPDALLRTVQCSLSGMIWTEGKSSRGMQSRQARRACSEADPGEALSVRLIGRAGAAVKRELFKVEPRRVQHRGYQPTRAVA